VNSSRYLFTDRPQVGSLAPIYGAILFLVAISVFAFIFATLPTAG